MPVSGLEDVEPIVRGATSDALTLNVWPAGEAALAEWSALERRIPDVPLAASRDWTETWLRHYGDRAAGRVVVGSRGGRTIGVCLITKGTYHTAGPLRLRTRHLGTAGEPDEESVCVEYNGLLAHAEDRDEFAARIVDGVLHDGGWDEFRIDGCDEAEARAWTRRLPEMQLDRRGSRYFDLAECRELEKPVIDRLGSSTRSALRRNLRKYGELEVCWAQTLDDADDILTELVELHQARWRAVGKPGAFASPRFLAFQRDLTMRLMLEGRVVLFRVRHAGATVGCLLLLNDRNRLLDYVSGFASFEEQPSPGIVTHYLCMEEALRRGYAAYDFLVGDKRHKENLSTHSRDLVWGVWRRPNWKNRVVMGLRAARDAMRGRAADSTIE